MIGHRPSLAPVSVDGVDLLMDRSARERGWLVGFSSRCGGVSEAPFDTLNLAARSGDVPEHVSENRRRAAAATGFEVERLALARQVHAAGVIEVAVGDSGVLGEADILVTREPGPVLGILTADCAPVLVAGVDGAAIAHAGWRGLVSGAIDAAVAAVGRTRSAWIGPCIHACCYQVGPEVIEAFRAAGLPTAGDGRVDPGRAAAFALHRLGVDEVAASESCTSCDGRYFSYRRDGVTGRQGSFLGLLQA
jgi:polyphenol oxidase